jgi:hypothetical protein
MIDVNSKAMLAIILIITNSHTLIVCVNFSVVKPVGVVICKSTSVLRISVKKNKRYIRHFHKNQKIRTSVMNRCSVDLTQCMGTYADKTDQMRSSKLRVCEVGLCYRHNFGVVST